jgi:hypothetical protein
VVGQRTTFLMPNLSFRIGRFALGVVKNVGAFILGSALFLGAIFLFYVETKEELNIDQA